MINILVKKFSRQTRIKEKLYKEFNPAFLEVVNESFKHAVPKDSETHFKIIIVSNDFKGIPVVSIHRKIYSMFNDEMGEKKDNKLHALSIVTKTEDEFKDKIPDSPNCVFKL